MINEFKEGGGEEGKGEQGNFCESQTLVRWHCSDHDSSGENFFFFS